MVTLSLQSVNKKLPQLSSSSLTLFDTIDRGNYVFRAPAGKLNPGPTLRSPDPDLQPGVLTTGLTRFTEPKHGQS